MRHPRELVGLAGSATIRDSVAPAGLHAGVIRAGCPLTAGLAISVALAASLGSLGCGAGSADSAAPEADRSDRSRVDVQVVSPLRQEMTRQVELPASVAAFETTTLLSKISGYLASINVDIGDSVRSGQLIAQVDVPELRDQVQEAKAELEAKRADLAASKAELESARAELGLRRITHERIQAVRNDEPDVMPQQTLDEARAGFELASAAVRVGESRIKQIEGTIKQVQASIKRLQTLVGFAKIQAPFDGVVTQRHVDPGTLLQAETSSRMVQQIVTIASVNRVRLRVDVPEAEVPFVQVGDAASVVMDSMPGRVFEGSVTRFAGSLDPSTRTMRTEIDLPNPELILRPGMYGRATLSLDTKPDVITIPADSLRVDGEAEFVYCVVDGRARRFDVKATVGDGVVVEVTDGLEGTESVVVTARGPIVDGAPVNSAELRQEGYR